MLLRFRDCILDLDRRELARNGDPVALEPQVYELLAYLVANRDRAVSKAELLDEIWKSRYVSEAALTSRIRAVRLAVGDSGRAQTVIKTLHGHGYRFVADVDELSARSRPSAGTDLVERDGPLDDLRAAVESAVAEGRGTVALIAGEAGIGKSALVRVLRDDVGGQVRFLVGRCDDLTNPRTLGPIRDMAVEVGGALATAVDSGEPDRVLDAMHRELQGSAAVIVVEDAHWADDATFDVIRFLARRIADLASLLIVTYRDDELAARHPIRQLLGSLGGESVLRIALEPLSEAAVGALAAESDIDPLELHSLSRGNPFFVTESLAAGDVEVPASVRDAVLRRADRLSDATRLHLCRLSVVPSRVERWLADLVAPDGVDAATSLAEAEEMGVLSGDATRVWFRHELARRALETSLTAADRVAAHRAILDHVTDVALDSARVLHHAVEAGETDLIARYAPAAADEAAALGSHRQAAGHLMVYMDQGGDLAPEERADALRQRAYSLYVVNRFDASFECAAESVELHRALGRPAALARSLIVLARTALWARGPMAARAAASEATDVLGDADAPAEMLALAYSDLARALSNLTTLGLVAEPSLAALEAATRACELAEAVGEDEVLSQALNYRGTSRLALGDEGGSDDLRRAAALSENNPRIEIRMRALVNEASSLLRDGHPSEAAALAQRGIDRSTDGEFYAGVFRLGLTRDVGRLAGGDWDAAEDGLLDLVGSDFEPGIMLPLARALLARLLARRDRPGVEELLIRAEREAGRTGDVHVIGPVAAARLEVLWLRGRVDEMPGVAAPVLHMAAEQGHALTAAEVTRYLQRAGHDPPIPADPPGPWLPAVLGDWSAAVDAWSRSGDRYEAALERVASGSEPMMLSGLLDLDDLGATATAAVVRRALRAMGAKSVPRGPNVDTRRDPAGLTARQRDVLLLMAEGLTNPEIGERLYLSTRTVDHHVAAILAKLGAPSRAAAVAVARERSLVS